MKNFNQIYAQFYTVVLNFISFKLHNTEVAEELTNDVFIKVNSHLESYNNKYSFKTWLFTIVRNTIIDYYRSEGKRNNHFINVGSFVNDEGKEFFSFLETDQASDNVENNQLSNKISLALNNLKGNYKIVADLFFVHEKQYNEIAEILQIPLNTVKVTLMRAKEMLQTELVQEYENMLA
jgi:RNA polymerase sigma-70 factor (ECF subfamily)